MTAEFVDTNILFYAHDAGALSKHLQASELITRLVSGRTAAASTQVFIEFYSAVTRKGKLPAAEARAILKEMAHWSIHRPTVDDLAHASQLQERHKISWWDALILCSAQTLGCETLWSEDFTHGRRFGSLTVRNPFHKAEN